MTKKIEGSEEAKIEVKVENLNSIDWDDMFIPLDKPMERYFWSDFNFRGRNEVYYSHKYLGRKKIATFKHYGDAQKFVREKNKELKANV